MFRSLRMRWELFKCAAFGHYFGDWERVGLRVFFHRWCRRCGHKETGVKASGGRILPVGRGEVNASRDVRR